jgi:uncharacterized phiE125 gp8 family phage protein
MHLTETAPAAELPVARADLAQHLRLVEGFDNEGAEDALLDLYLETATAAVETRLARALVRRGFSLEVDAWDRTGRLVLPVGPVPAIGGFVFLGGDAPEPAALDGLVLSPGECRQALSGPGGGPLPAIPAGRRVELTFDAGYGPDRTSVPEDLRQAVLLLAAHLHERRYGEAPEGPVLPGRVEALIAPHRPVRL